MPSKAHSPSLHSPSVLLRAEPQTLLAWTGEVDSRRLALCVGCILVGAGVFGAAMGCWRSPLQALFVAIKFPLIILLATLGNSLLNAMLAPLLGLNTGFRQSFFAILMSFAIASAILGALSPLTAFLVWNAPPLSHDLQAAAGAHNLIKLTQVALIASAGIAANLRLYGLLLQLCGDAIVARRVLVAWLASNLFLGSQLAWILRPFIGSPALPVEFVRLSALRGNFYENVWYSLLQLFNPN